MKLSDPAVLDPARASITVGAAGSDRRGELLWAFAFDAHGRARTIAAAEAAFDLDAFGGGFVWLHYDLDAAGLGPSRFDGLGPFRLAEAVFGADEHQGVTVDGDHIGGVVVDLARPGAKPVPAGRLHFMMGPRILVSGRRDLRWPVPRRTLSGAAGVSLPTRTRIRS